MNKLVMIFLMGAGSFFQLFAQTDPTVKPRERVIEVTGSAEMEVVPDEIYLSVTLREYSNKDKSKVRLDEIDKKFMKTLSELGIDIKNVSLEGANAYYNWDYWRNKQTEFYASKTYIIKLPDLSKYNQLMEKMDKQGVQYAYLQRTDNSKIEEYRKQVKIEALKAAKEKATQLLEAIGEHTGEVLLIREINQGGYYPMAMYKSNVAMESADGGQPQAEMQKIKLRFEMEVHFRIK